MSRQDLSPRLTLGVPLAIAVMTLFFILVIPEKMQAWYNGELGILENLQVVALVAALIVGLRTFFDPAIRGDRRIHLWVGLFCLGVIYTLGEEISWGQHFVGWGTPEWYQSINDQNETNLHNTSAWFDQKPRWLLELSIYYAALVRPLWLRTRKRVTTSRLPGWVWPTAVCITPAAFMFGALVGDWIGEAFNISFEGFRPSEMREVYIYFFLYCYIASFSLRARGGLLK